MSPRRRVISLFVHRSLDSTKFFATRDFNVTPDATHIPTQCGFVFEHGSVWSFPCFRGLALIASSFQFKVSLEPNRDPAENECVAVSPQRRARTTLTGLPGYRAWSSISCAPHAGSDSTTSRNSCAQIVASFLFTGFVIRYVLLHKEGSCIHVFVCVHFSKNKQNDPPPKPARTTHTQRP